MASTITPNATVQGKLDNLLATTLDASGDINGTIQFALCGYGSQIPRVAGEALFSDAQSSQVQMQTGVTPEGPAGTFLVVLFSNDLITPDGTYYTATVRNLNGDVLQVNAYRFIGGGTFDLTVTEPYDPNQPPPPLPPLITNQLLVVPWSATMEFPGDTFTTYRITLSGDVTSSTAPGTVQGNLYTFIIQQDAVGGHHFTWPINMYNPSPINPDPSGFTVQTFVMGVYNLIPIGPAGWWG
jgi:hypothetical protein